MEENDYLLGSVNKAMQILDLLADKEKMSLTELQKATGHSKTGVFRLLYTLEKSRMVMKTEDGNYSLGLHLAYLGSIVVERQDIAKIARPAMQQLRNKVNETVHLGILDDTNHLVFIAKEIGNSNMHMNSKVGARMPAYSTAMGKVLLAALDTSKREQILQGIQLKQFTRDTISNLEDLRNNLIQIRADGYGEDKEESEIGLHCIAAPIYNRQNAAVCAISISGPVQRMSVNKEEKIAVLKETAQSISERLI